MIRHSWVERAARWILSHNTSTQAACDAIIALAIVWVIALLTHNIFANALTKPTFWVVEGATIALTSLAVLAPEDNPESQKPVSTRPVNSIDRRRRRPRSLARRHPTRN